MPTKEEYTRATEKQKEKSRESSNTWKKKNRDICKKYEHKYDAKRRKEQKLNRVMSVAVCNSLKGQKNFKKWQVLVGYSIDDLKRHLEKQFLSDMNWQNYGKYWHVDHITPQSWFKFKFPEDKQFKLCWSLKNLRPMYAEDNLRKNNKLILEN